MYERIRNFLRDTDGAITVDWVVLTAAVVTITLLFLSDLTGKLDTAAGGLETRMAPIVSNMPSINF